MGYLSNIDRIPSGGQMGGVITIDLVRKADVQSIPVPQYGAINGEVVLKAGASFFRWRVTQKTAGVNSSSRITREGPTKENRLRFFIALDREAVRTMLEQAELDEFIVIYQYANGKKKIFGLLESPVRFEFSHDSGIAPADSNGNNCSFYYDGPDNTYFYNADSPSIGSGPAPVIVKHNGEVIAILSPGQTFNIESEFGFTDFYTSTTT